MVWNDSNGHTEDSSPEEEGAFESMGQDDVIS